MSLPIFHLAIPCRDLDEAHHFYVKQLGALPARRYADRMTLNFYGTQLVCHLCPEAVEENPQVYPRHFGLILPERQAFDKMVLRIQAENIPLFQELKQRFSGQPEAHLTLFILDPSHNVIEFKHPLIAEMSY